MTSRLALLLCAAALTARAEQDVAVAYINLGTTLSEPFLNASVSTLRGRRAFAGSVYVVTDHAACAPPTATPLVVSLNGCKFYKSMGYKFFKTKLLSLVPRDHALVMYLDVDILVGGPVAALFEDPLVERFAAGASGPHVVGVRDKGGGRGVRWHGGFSVLRRETSEGCLAAWAAEILSTPFNSDQKALKRAQAKGSCRYAALDERYFAWPSRASLVAGDFKTLNHFTRTGRVRGHHGIRPEHLDAVTLFGAPRPGWYNAVDDACLRRADASRWEPVYRLQAAECARLDRRRMDLGNKAKRDVAAGQPMAAPRRKRGFVPRPVEPFAGPPTPHRNKDSRGWPCAGVCD